MMARLDVVLLCLSVLGGACAACYVLAGCRDPKTPAAYGAALAWCHDQASSWDQYEPCCAEVAREFGRDPGFCYRNYDAGAP